MSHWGSAWPEGWARPALGELSHGRGIIRSAIVLAGVMHGGTDILRWCVLASCCGDFAVTLRVIYGLSGARLGHRVGDQEKRRE